MKALNLKNDFEIGMPYVSVGEPAWRVWRKMKRLNSLYVAVVNGQALVGVVMERDIRMISQVHGGESADVTEVMIPNPKNFFADSTIFVVLSNMLEKHLDFIVLVDNNHKALKVITVHEIIKYIMTMPNKESWGNLKDLLEKNE